MRAKFKKSKGTTLIEVLISISIFTIISIPLSMTVISSISNNKKSENKQYAVVVAQQIVEQLKANSTGTPRSSDTAYNLNFINISDTSTGYIGYKATNADVGNGFETDVTFEKKKNLSYSTTISNVVEYDLSIVMDSSSIVVKGTDSTGVDVNRTYSIMDDLKICNNSNNTIQLKENSTNNVLGGDSVYYVSKDGLIDNIKISYSSNYGPKDIYLENNLVNPLAVYIFKQGNEEANTFKNLKGSIKFYDNLSSIAIPVDNTSGIYDINVDIYKGGSTNKVKIYSTKASISIEP